MIQVTNLTQYYGKHCAVNNLNFTLKKGQLTGFLGSNGAGKSTTLNLVSGYLQPSKGSVTINGYSMQTQEMQAKALIGYLPEQPPLYLDLTVEEYLAFIASLKKVSKATFKTDQEKIYSLLHLGNQKERLIKNLSKGYRQRVGFAGAMVGNPPIVILDEPTAGLDPNQIIETRNLIKSLKAHHTLLVSSHILSEIEAICDMALILNQGKIVAFDTMPKLATQLKGHHTIIIKVVNHEKNLAEKLKEIAGLETLEKLDPTEEGVENYKLIAPNNLDIRQATYQTLKNCNITLLSMAPQGGILEEVFRQATQLTENQKGDNQN